MENIENTLSASSIKYEGIVTISVVDNGGRTIYSRSGHNQGTAKLFNFLASCLAGKYTDANEYRPSYVRVFSLGQAGETIPETPTYDDEKTMAPVLAMPAVKYDSDAHSATYKFMIPYSRLDLSAAVGDANLYCIYGNANKTTASDNSAYFIVTDEDDDTKLGKAFDWATAKAQQNKLNLVIEWTMTIGNL